MYKIHLRLEWIYHMEATYHPHGEEGFETWAGGILNEQSQEWWTENVLECWWASGFLGSLSSMESRASCLETVSPTEADIQQDDNCTIQKLPPLNLFFFFLLFCFVLFESRFLNIALAIPKLCRPCWPLTQRSLLPLLLECWGLNMCTTTAWLQILFFPGQ